MFARCRRRRSVSLSVQYLTCRAAIGVAIGVVIKLAFVEFAPDFPCSLGGTASGIRCSEYELQRRQ